MSSVQKSLSFALELQAALTVEEIEDAYVRAVENLIFARGRGLYRVDLETQGFVVGQVADVPQLFLDAYDSVDRNDDPVLLAAIEGSRPVASSDRDLGSSWAQSRAREVLASFGYGHSLKAPLVIDGVLWGSIHFTRYHSDPPFSARDHVAAALAVDHLGAALTRALRHDEQAGRAEVFAAALDLVGEPIVVSDAAGATLHYNRAAASPQSDENPLADLVGPAIQEATELIRSAKRRVVIATLDGSDGEHISVRSVAVPRHSATVSIVYTKAGATPQVLPILSILSRREQEIAQLVSEGLSTAEIAQRAFITENTVKQHLKRIFMKLHVRSRAELVQTIWAASSAKS